MANPHRGYVELDVGEHTYRLKFDYNAIAELDDKLGYSSVTATDEQFSSIKFIRAALWAGLQHDARFARMTLAGAGRMMEKAGLERVTVAVMAAIQSGFGKLSEAPDATDKADSDGPLDPSNP